MPVYRNLISTRLVFSSVKSPAMLSMRALAVFREVRVGMQIRKTRPYSPWQNGKIERSHREDGKILYKRKVFTSEAELKKQVQKHEGRYNRTAKTSLDFKSPNQVVEEYFSKCNICLDS